VSARTTTAIHLWGTHVATATYDRDEALAYFEYEPAFAASGIEFAPLQMPLIAGRTYAFPNLDRRTFLGLPGLLADSLPDRFGHALIDAWLASRGRTPESFDPIERLCYIGRRGMGALEFEPRLGLEEHASTALDVSALVDLASRALTDREGLAAALREEDPDRSVGEAVQTILRVGTSAGGARAKAVIGWNRDTGEIRSGQLDLPEGFEHWILKFDGVRNNRDRELEDPAGFGRIEFAYHRMARAAGITMTECRLLEENGRAHFMTRRFDRVENARRRDAAGERDAGATDEPGDKLHMQTLAALAHLDFNQPGANSYEQALLTARRIGAPTEDLEQILLRAVFNIVTRNQDDHVKNLAFLMDRDGRWRLSPAFDVTYAFNPAGDWTSRHQMSLGGKRDAFTLDDIRTVADTFSLRRGCAREMIDTVQRAAKRWPEFAAEAGIPASDAERIGATYRSLG
jgi:serine/threonine-protein kinase HipA